MKGNEVAVLHQPVPGTVTMLGEFGGIGMAVEGHHWVPGHCGSYHNAGSAASLTTQYEAFITQLKSYQSLQLSIAIWTQYADVELECNGLLTYDRLLKLSTSEIQRVAELNRGFTRRAAALVPPPRPTVDGARPPLVTPGEALWGLHHPSKWSSHAAHAVAGKAAQASASTPRWGLRLLVAALGGGVLVVLRQCWAASRKQVSADSRFRAALHWAAERKKARLRDMEYAGVLSEDDDPAAESEIVPLSARVRVDEIFSDVGSVTDGR